MAVQPHEARQSGHVFGCLGFWLWAFVGAAGVLAFISFIGWLFLVPAAVVGYRLAWKSRWNEGPVMLGVIAGAGLPLMVVAAINWSGWHNRVAGDNTPNPYYWGGVGLCLLAVGTVAYAVRARPS